MDPDFYHVSCALLLFRNGIAVLTPYINFKSFSFLSCKRVGNAVFELINYVCFFLLKGELGWEFYVKNDEAADLYDAIMNAGQKHGIGHIGSYAVNSMRLEKGFRLWGAEVQ